jgi:hypothetical protein
MDTDPAQHDPSDRRPPADDAEGEPWDAAAVARFERLRSGDAAPDDFDPLSGCLAAVGNPSCPLEAIERAQPLAAEAAYEELQRTMRADFRKMLDSIALLVIGVALTAIGAIRHDRWLVLLMMGGILGALVLLRVIVNAFRRRLIHRLCGKGCAEAALLWIERLNMLESVVVAAAYAALLVGGGFIVTDRWMGGNIGMAIGFGLFLWLPVLGRTIDAIRSASLSVHRRAPIVGSGR